MSNAAVSSSIRGFSFMPERKLEVDNLQYVEGEELERTWKTSRRQRLKQQEQKIWEEFVKEQDVLNNVCKDDPYQFLEQLPESCLKELMEAELEKMRKEMKEASEKKIEDQKQEGDGDVSRENYRNEELVTVTFCEDKERSDEHCDMFHIFDDEKDDDKEDEHSGAELEAAEGSSSPCTVRERHSPPPPDPAPPRSPDRTSSKSPENVSNMIESSIYCAKVRDLRPKIINEMVSIIEYLEQRNISTIDPEELPKMCRRSTEFCSRFNRIYMYQLHRQIHDIKRNNSVSMPFARHTHFQSQMVRIVSLHQNLLQALQVAGRSLQQTACVGESAALLQAVARLTAAANAACCDLPPHPRALPAAALLYEDDMLVTCDRLDHVVSEYATRVTAYITSTNSTDGSRSKKTSTTGKKKKNQENWSKCGSKKKTDTDSRLSMYSLDTLRINLHPKSSSSRDNHSSATSKRGGVSCNGRKSDSAASNPPQGKSSRKSPRRGRPLMRAPGSGRARPPRPRADADVRTMVEVIDPCTSSYMSREVSPRQSGKNSKTTTPPVSRNQTPRLPKENLRKSSPLKYRAKAISPRKPPSPKLQPALNSIQSLSEDQSIADTPPKIFPNKKKSEGTQATEIQKKPTPKPSPRAVEEDVEKLEKDRCKALNLGPGRCEVTRIVRQLCGGDAAGSRHERVSGAKNAQLHCVTGGSPRQPSTPQLLRILEETIQKKVPKTLFHKPPTAANIDRFKLAFNIPEQTTERVLQYRTKFVQHMLASPMYANCTIGKPWEIVGSISEQLIDDLLEQCAKEMQLQNVVQELYKVETCN